MRYVCDFFYETMDLVGPTKECIGENQQPLGGLVADKKVRPHVPQKEKPTKRAPFEGLSAKKSSPFVNSGRILFLLSFNPLYCV